MVEKKKNGIDLVISENHIFTQKIDKRATMKRQK